MGHQPSSLVEPHFSRLFVERNPSIERVFSLLKKPNRRLHSLVGPPGVGKSWHLWRVYLEMKKPNAPRRPVRFLPIYLDLNALADGDAPLEEALNAWLTGVLAENGLSGLPDSERFHTRFQRFAIEICDKCGDRCVAVLLLDGIDEIDEHEQDIIVTRVVTEFLKEAEPACTRVLMAFRDPSFLRSPPARDQQHQPLLELTSDDTALQPTQQIELLLDHLATGGLTLGAAHIGQVLHRADLSDVQAAAMARRAAAAADTIVAGLADFLTGHFLVNARLLGHVLLDERGRVTPDYLWDCLRHYMARLTRGRDAGEREEDLRTALRLIELLRDKELEPRCGPCDLWGWSYNDLYERRIAKKLDAHMLDLEGDMAPLLKAGIVVQLKPLGEVYKIDPSLVRLFDNLERLGVVPGRLPRA